MLLLSVPVALSVIFTVVDTAFDRHNKDAVFKLTLLRQNSLKEIELHFLAQSFYHDEIRMYRKTDGNSWLAAGIKPDGTAVLSGRMKF